MTPKKLLSLILLIFTTKLALGFGIQAGVSLLEEGDDRQRPGAYSIIDFGDYSIPFYYYSLKQGPVHSKVIQVGFTKDFKMSDFIKGLNLSLGGVVMDEAYSFEAGSITETKITEDAYNFGGLIRLNYLLYDGAIDCLLNWDSAYYPAGSATLFLVIARKQMLTLSVGVDL